MPKHEFSVSVTPQFQPEHSQPDQHHYVFAYTVKIRNTGEQAAQLISRHWIITDANNKIEEVEGAGVVGEQPTLQPGQSFEYTSGCPLETPVGSMHGTYHCVGADGTRFDAPIPEFVLSMPSTLH